VERVCIVGAGVIGSLFAGHLARVCEVSVLTRRREHADALNERGLRVTGKSDYHARVVATDDPDAVPAFDVAIVATKASGLEPAVRALEGRFPDATVVTVLNGIGAEAIVRKHGAWPIVSGVTFMSGTRHADTHVEYILDTETWLGPYENTPFDVVQDIAETIIASGL
jgi:2-dehydropantoate 2-reductase